MEPITLLVYALLAVLVVAIIWYVMRWLEVPDPPAKIILLVVVLILVLWLLQRSGVL